MSDQNRDTADNGENPEPESDGGRGQRQEEDIDAEAGGQSDEPESNSSTSQGLVVGAVGGSETIASDQPEDLGSPGSKLNEERHSNKVTAISPSDHGLLPEGHGEGRIGCADGDLNSLSLSEVEDCVNDQTEDSVPVHEVYREGGFGMSGAEDISASGNPEAEGERAEDDMFSESALERMSTNDIENNTKTASTPAKEQEEPEEDVVSESWNRNSNSYSVEVIPALSADPNLAQAQTQGSFGVSIDVQLEELLLVTDGLNQPEGMGAILLEPTSEDAAESCSSELYSATDVSQERQNTDTLSESDPEDNASGKTSEEAAEGSLASRPEGQNTDTLSESDPEDNASGEIVCNEDVEADCSQNSVQGINLGHGNLQGNSVESHSAGISRLNDNAESELGPADNTHDSPALSDCAEALCQSSSDGASNVERVGIVDGGQLEDVLVNETGDALVNEPGDEPEDSGSCHVINPPGDALVNEPGDEPEDSGSCHVINPPQLASSSETDLYAPECDRRQTDANSPSENSVLVIAEPVDFESRADNRCLDASNVQSNTPASEVRDSDNVNIPSNIEHVASDAATLMSNSEFQPLEVGHVPSCQQNSNLLEEVELGPTRCTGISDSDLDEDILRSADLIQSLCENKDSLSEDSTEMVSVAVNTHLNSFSASTSVESTTNTVGSKPLDPSHILVTNTSKCKEQTVEAVHSRSEHSNSIACLENLPSVLCKDISTEYSVNGSRDSVSQLTSEDHLTTDENLLNELDAELEPMSSKNSSITNGNSSSTFTISDEKSPCLSEPINGLKVKPFTALCEFSNGKLQEVLADLQKQIFEKDSTIARLESDKALQSEKLEFIVYERDSYLKQLQATKSKQQADDLYLPQIKELEYTIAQQQTEIRSYKDKLASHDAAAKRAVGALQNELKVRVDQATKMSEDCRKEKDSMVIKYAQAENKNIDLQKATEKAEGRLRDIFREREIFLTKAKHLKADYQRTCSELETKTTELSAITKELEKHKELVTSSEVRIKWAQNKLKAELDTHKETKKELDKSVSKIKESKEETAQIRRDCQAIIKTYQESEEMKSSTLDQRLRKKESELLLEKQEKTDQSEVFQSVVKELDALKVQFKDNLEELNTYKDKVHAQESERLTNEDTMTKYKGIIQTQKRENRELQAKIDKLFHFQSDFDRAQDMIKNLDADIRDLKLTNKELQTELESCRKRESDLLNLTKKLTEKNAHLQSENTTLSGQIMNLISDNQKKDMDLQEFQTKLKDVSDKLDEEVKSRKSETTSLAENLNSKSQTNEDLTRTVEEQKDEIKTLKRRHASNIKDLTRQLQQAKRRLDSADSKGDNKETVSMGSRTSSNGSLNTPSGDMNGGQSTAAPARVPQAESPPQEYPVIVEQVEIDREVLVNRIVRLQKAHARKNEKIEFMEDHINQLLAEVKKKKRIIQHYVMREETGALSTENMDINKAELTKRGGIMASVYSSHASDSHMSLDLSLEINRKLQSVLEDTLLKNITLKENIDTLGEEIARLSQENRRIQLTLQGLS